MTGDCNLLDPDRCVCLCEDGLPGFWAAVAVAADGTEHLLLAERDSVGDEQVTYDRACPDAPHERLGPLPSGWRARLQLAPLRCGRLTKAGTPCRTPVTRAGDACGWHRTAEKSVP